MTITSFVATQTFSAVGGVDVDNDDMTQLAPRLFPL